MFSARVDLRSVDCIEHSRQKIKSYRGRVEYLELEQAKKRVEELRAVIEKNNRLYYDQDAPELEDFEYDALTRELKELEAQFPQLVTAASPTQKVGGTASSKLPKVTHAVKMESLLDAFSFDELRDFDRRVREAGVEPEYVVEIKIDGLSCSLEYENGQLVRASTVVTAWWARMLPQTCVPSAASPRPLKMHRNFWRCAARCICRTRPFSTCAPSRNCRALHPSKTPAMQRPVLCGRRMPVSPAAGDFPSLCSTCSRSVARP